MYTIQFCWCDDAHPDTSREQYDEDIKTRKQAAEKANKKKKKKEIPSNDKANQHYYDSPAAERWSNTKKYILFENKVNVLAPVTTTALGWQTDWVYVYYAACLCLCWVCCTTTVISSCI